MVNVGLEARHQTVCLEIWIHHQSDDSNRMARLPCPMTRRTRLTTNGWRLNDVCHRTIFLRSVKGPLFWCMGTHVCCFLKRLLVKPFKVLDHGCFLHFISKLNMCFVQETVFWSLDTI